MIDDTTARKPVTYEEFLEVEQAFLAVQDHQLFWTAFEKKPRLGKFPYVFVAIVCLVTFVAFTLLQPLGVFTVTTGVFGFLGCVLIGLLAGLLFVRIIGQDWVASGVILENEARGYKWFEKARAKHFSQLVPEHLHQSASKMELLEYTDDEQSDQTLLANHPFILTTIAVFIAFVSGFAAQEDLWKNGWGFVLLGIVSMILIFFWQVPGILIGQQQRHALFKKLIRRIPISVKTKVSQTHKVGGG
jgi:hypothetical protein